MSMSAQSSAMSPPTQSWPRYSLSTLLRRLGAVYLVEAVAAIGFGFVYKFNVTLLSSFLIGALAAGLGLTAGFAARWILKRQTVTLRILTAFTAVVIGVIYLSWVKWGSRGISLTLSLADPLIWIRPALISIGTIAAFLAMGAWHRTNRTRIEVERREGPPPKPAPAPSPAPASVRPPNQQLATPTAPRRSFLPKPHLQRPKLLRRRRHQVRLRSDEEHRCPYCLQSVERNDPRGVTVCRVCHTWHHSDCWAITGMCQVPHHHA
jgi:hypothetical protein